jgi:hypothetical protein
MLLLLPLRCLLCRCKRLIAAQKLLPQLSDDSLVLLHLQATKGWQGMKQQTAGGRACFLKKPNSQCQGLVLLTAYASIVLDTCVCMHIRGTSVTKESCTTTSAAA